MDGDGGLANSKLINYDGDYDSTARCRYELGPVRSYRQVQLQIAGFFGLAP
jgi:hypothetical protein